MTTPFLPASSMSILANCLKTQFLIPPPIPSPRRSLDSHNQIDVGSLFALLEHAVQCPNGNVRRPVERILEFPLAVVDGRVDGGVHARSGHRVAEHDRGRLQQATRHLKLEDI